MGNSACPKCAATDGVILDHTGAILSCSKCDQTARDVQEARVRDEQKRKVEDETREEARERTNRERATANVSIGSSVASLFAAVTTIFNEGHKSTVEALTDDELPDDLPSMEDNNSPEVNSLNSRILTCIGFLARSPDDLSQQRDLAGLLKSKGETFYAEGKIKASDQAYGEYVRRFASNADPCIQRLTAEVMHRKARDLFELKKYRQAVETSNIMLSKFEYSEGFNFQHHVAHALAIKAYCLRELNRPKEAINAWNVLIKRYSDFDLACVRSAVEYGIRSRNVLLKAVPKA